MECLNSFSIGINQGRTFAVAGTNVKNWGPAGNYHWVVTQQGSSVYNIFGYKRIDLYGVQMSGYVQTDVGLNDGAIVSDYGFQIGIGGQIPFVSGEPVIAPNDFAISENIGQFYLSKFDNKIMFESPYIGCQNISFTEFQAQGNNGETLNSISLDLRLVFTFYYKYQ